MKKTIILSALMAAFAISANAQFKVGFDLKCTPKVRHKTIRVLCIESLHLKNDWRLC